MSNSLAQVLPLFGVLVGAIGSHLLTVRTDRSRFRRERLALWEDKQIDAYAQYGQALKMSIVIAARMTAFNGNQPHPNPLRPEEGDVLLGEAVAVREQAWEHVLLVGSRKVISIATEWYRAVWDLEHFAKSREVNPERWKELWKHVDRLRSDYYGKIRETLDLGDMRQTEVKANTKNA